MKLSELARVRNFLEYMSPQTFTPDAIKDALLLKLSPATIGRKLRQYAKAGTVLRSYYRNDAGEEIAQYAFNREHYLRQAQVRDALEREAAVQMGNNGEGLPHYYPEEPNDEPPTTGGKMEQETLF